MKDIIQEDEVEIKESWCKKPDLTLVAPHARKYLASSLSFKVNDFCNQEPYIKPWG